MAFVPPDELTEGDLELPEIPDDEPTKVGSPSPAELERARAEALAMLRQREEAEQAEQAARERAEQERAAKERAEQERARAAREQAEQERAAREQAARARAARERAEQERAAREQAERARAASEQAERAQAERQLEVPVLPGAFAPPPAFGAPPQGHGFGEFQINLPPLRSVTTPLEAVGLTTQKLPTAPPPAPMPPPPLLVDVTPLTLAVETVDGFCDSIIARNTTVPCSRTREFVTAADNQTSVRIRVSQGESSRFAENTLLGEVELSGLRPARRGDVRIGVSFALDSSGMLVVSAKDVGTGRETSTQVHLVGLPDAEEVARMAARQAGRGV
jgi:hypothetical protein